MHNIGSGSGGVSIFYLSINNSTLNLSSHTSSNDHALTATATIIDIVALPITLCLL